MESIVNREDHVDSFELLKDVLISMSQYKPRLISNHSSTKGATVALIIRINPNARGSKIVTPSELQSKVLHPKDKHLQKVLSENEKFREFMQSMFSKLNIDEILFRRLGSRRATRNTVSKASNKSK